MTDSLNSQQLTDSLNSQPLTDSLNCQQFTYSHESQLLTDNLNCQLLTSNLNSQPKRQYKLSTTERQSKLLTKQNINVEFIKIYMFVLEATPVIFINHFQIHAYHFIEKTVMIMCFLSKLHISIQLYTFIKLPKNKQFEMFC